MALEHGAGAVEPSDVCNLKAAQGKHRPFFRFSQGSERAVYVGLLYRVRFECQTLYINIKNGGRIKGGGKTPKTSKNTSQRRKTQGPGKGLEEAKNRSAPHPGKRVWEGLQTKEC